MILLPFAVAHLKLAGACLTPFGHIIVPIGEAQPGTARADQWWWSRWGLEAAGQVGDGSGLPESQARDERNPLCSSGDSGSARAPRPDAGCPAQAPSAPVTGPPRRSSDLPAGWAGRLRPDSIQATRITPARVVGRPVDDHPPCVAPGVRSLG